MFIGDKEIKLVEEVEDGNAKVTFADDSSTVINTELLGEITSEEEGKGNITDAVYHYFSTRFLADLAYYKLEYYTVEGVAMAMRVLAHNLREEAIKKAFGCSGGDAIRLDKLSAELSEGAEEVTDEVK
jgi:hypothetical protein